MHKKQPEISDYTFQVTIETQQLLAQVVVITTDEDLEPDPLWGGEFTCPDCHLTLIGQMRQSHYAPIASAVQTNKKEKEENMFKIEAVCIVGIPVKEREVESAYQTLCLYRGWYHERYVARVIISIALLERRRNIVPGSFADQVTPLQISERWKTVKRSEVSSYKFHKARAELLEDWFGISPDEPEPQPERPAPPLVDERQLRLFE